MSKFAASQSEARGWFVCPPKNWRCNPSTTCCGPAIVHDYPSPNCFEHCTCGSGRSDVDGHVGMMSVIMETWQDNGCMVQSLKGREPWQRDVMVRLVSSFHLVSCCWCIFISEFSLLAPPSVSQMSPTWAFKHTTILVFISVAFFLSPLWTPRSMQNSLIVFFATPPSSENHWRSWKAGEAGQKIFAQGREWRYIKWCTTFDDGSNPTVLQSRTGSSDELG